MILVSFNVGDKVVSSKADGIVARSRFWPSIERISSSGCGTKRPPCQSLEVPPSPKALIAGNPNCSSDFFCSSSDGANLDIASSGREIEPPVITKTLFRSMLESKSAATAPYVDIPAPINM